MHLEIKNLSFRYKSVGASPQHVLQDINLTVEAGDFLALVGPSGSGKTSLMQHLTGLLTPDKGEVLVDGQALHAPGVDLASIRRRIGLVFQFPETQLFEETVFDDVAFGPRNLGLAEAEIRCRVEAALKRVAVDFERFENRNPLRLSEGEKRRVAIAGVLAMQPEFIALDEPTMGLDFAGVQVISHMLRELHARGKSILLISHDLDLVAGLVDRVVVIDRGRIRFDGHKAELFRHPDKLRDYGLVVPRMRRLIGYLENAGLVRSSELYTLPQIKQELAAVINGRRQKDKVFQNKPLAEK